MRSSRSPSEERAPSLHLDALEDGFARVWRRLAGDPQRADGTGPYRDAAATLAAHESALGAVATAFADGPVRLRPAEAAGGVGEGMILMPRRIGLSPDPAANRAFLFLRAALAGALAGDDALAPTPGRDEAALLSRGAETACHLARDSDGFRRRAAACARIELAARPTPESLLEHHRSLERVRRAALDVAAALDDAPALAARRAQLDRAIAHHRDAVRTGATEAPASRLRRLFFSEAGGPPPPAPTLFFGGPLTPTDRATAAGALAEDEDGGGVADGATEREAPVRDHVRQLTLEEDPYKANMPMHSFEKIDFAERYDGGQRRVDGADDMDDQGESLDAVDLREIIRGGPEVQSLYSAEIGDVGRIPDVDHVDPAERGIRYDEWDQRGRTYRRDWVTLYPTPIGPADPAFGEALARSVRPTTRRALRALERRRTERQARNRQLDGDAIDLDGVVDDHAERRRGGTPAGRVYVHSPRVERDTATCVLLDLSYSADSWVDDRRVLDVELAATCVLGEVADALGDALAILAFASKTRNLCRTWTVKDWRDPWPVARARLGGLKPQGYTRIGPAIRHATAVLGRHPARKRHMLLVTDGKPTDFDRYEGAHGVHDVAWAVREARRTEIGVHALCIDPRAAAILPKMFGPGAWRVLRHLAELPDALLDAYG